MKSVVVSGYFVVLHPGHIRMFKEARKMGDKLVVILNNDHQQLKKKGKIIVNQEDRKEVVGSVRYVDEVFISIDEDDTVRESLKKVRPDIFCNGGADRKDPNMVPEYPICQEFGINMVYGVGGFEKHSSSSEILKKGNS